MIPLMCPRWEWSIHELASTSLWTCLSVKVRRCSSICRRTYQSDVFGIWLCRRCPATWKFYGFTDKPSWWKPASVRTGSPCAMISPFCFFNTHDLLMLESSLRLQTTQGHITVYQKNTLMSRSLSALTCMYMQRSNMEMYIDTSYGPLRGSWCSRQGKRKEESNENCRNQTQHISIWIVQWSFVQTEKEWSLYSRWTK